MKHYFSETQDTVYEPFLIPIVARHLSFEIYSAKSIFSVASLDIGTSVLLKYAEVSGKILDLGCGYGVVGITLLLEDKTRDLTFVDISDRAIKLTQKNLVYHKLKGTVTKSNVLESVSETFDTILTNPPYNAGRPICVAFIKQSFEKLNVEGSLQLVCRRRKGGDVLEEEMKKIFGNVSVIGQKSGFRVYKSVKE
ncbi:MAG: class I SAM-dependent methyltransferase [Candidatus Woesearchaeota archaeon]